MVRTFKKLSDVEFEEAAEASREILRPAHRQMGALAGAAGIAVEDRGALKVRLQGHAQRVMRHSVPEIRGRNRPGLGVRDVEGPVGPGLVKGLIRYRPTKGK